MKLQTLLRRKSLQWCAGMLVLTLITGCSTTSSVNWEKQIGIYSWDDALADMGPPDQVTDQPGGIKMATWAKQRSVGITLAADAPSYVRGESISANQTFGSAAPAKVLQLSFTPDGKLFDWDRNY
jgi:hypothetical protein